MNFIFLSDDFDLPISKDEVRKWKEMLDEFDEKENCMKCKKCGSENVVELKNGKFLCLDCREEFKPKKSIEIIDPANCELVKIHRFKDDYYIKINTLKGNRFFRKIEGSIYEEFKYADCDLFEQQSLDNRVDFSKALKQWLG